MNLKERIISALPFHEQCFKRIQASLLCVRDTKRFSGGTATIDSELNDLAAVQLSNPSQISIDFDAFPDNALPINKGKCAKQCECVLFPEAADDVEWVLFIETKYVDSLENARNVQYGYPQQMINQIKSTVSYFRKKGIISSDKRVHAIMSFPTVEEGFDSWCFPVTYEDGHSESIEDIMFTDRIHIRATNIAQIKSNNRIKLGCL